MCLCMHEVFYEIGISGATNVEQELLGWVKASRRQILFKKPLLHISHSEFWYAPFTEPHPHRLNLEGQLSMYQDSKEGGISIGRKGVALNSGRSRSAGIR